MDTTEIKERALAYAIETNAGASYNDDGKLVIDADKIIEAATKFEAYMKGTNNV